MQFNSYVFIFVFLPVAILGYFLGNKVNSVVGKIILIVASIWFYTYAGWSTFIIILASILLNFTCAIWSRKRDKGNRLLWAVPVIINIGALAYLKYTNFTISNINILFGTNIALRELTQPLGISFFTFQQIAYNVSVYKKELKEISIIDYLAFILYFPKILMGPLVEPVDFMAQINDPEKKKIDWDNIACGIKLFSFGLFKKLVLADTFSKAVQWGYINIDDTTAVDWILIMLFYTFEIYFDFSGYSDMAVGCSLMLNIVLPMNFDSPYKALSIRDFWKRWHISLTKFFTKYIYIPLGGNRRGKIFTYLNTMIVFGISGIWHGANWTFILWGILHGAFSVMDRIIEKWENKIFRIFRWIVTFAVINILWLLFRSDSVTQWKQILQLVLLRENITVSSGFVDCFRIPESAVISNCHLLSNKWSWQMGEFWMILFILASMIICLLPNNNYRNMKKISWLSMFLAALAFCWAVICISGESVFVYLNF